MLCVVHSLHLDNEQALEDVLDVFNIMLCRQLAHQEVGVQWLAGAEGGGGGGTVRCDGLGIVIV